ncbi:hypothetical protein NQ314_002018 [Rhamnusium bicolor]|uniref:Uncharacterized protein n=1 Tax=Rhamnusium bicolor TaxID=1586634 RepID=A0AAV8ZU33_9CUCU|nr:hypothetical protein NQ314_002018 [Rhamnusium bicolor]
MLISNTGNRKIKPTKELNPEYIPIFLKVIHGNTNKKRVLVEQFLTHMANKGLTVDIKKNYFSETFKEICYMEKV